VGFRGEGNKEKKEKGQPNNREEILKLNVQLLLFNPRTEDEIHENWYGRSHGGGKGERKGKRGVSRDQREDERGQGRTIKDKGGAIAMTNVFGCQRHWEGKSLGKKNEREIAGMAQEKG